jgi:hypothetical protein
MCIWPGKNKLKNEFITKVTFDVHVDGKKHEKAVWMMIKA